MKKLVFINEKKDKIINILTGKGFSYNNANKILRNKDVKIDGIKTKDNIDVFKGSEIIIFYNDEMFSNKNFEIVYQDDNIVIVNKPSGIEIEGENSLSAILNLIPVHRLDRNTTGLVIFAKNREAEIQLKKAIKERKIVKKYLAQVVGETSFKNYLMKAYLLKDSKTSFVKIFQNQVKNSVEIATIFNTIKSSPSSSTIECELITGRTHQIRASLSYLGHPIIGDGKYGKNEDNKKFKQHFQQLHCHFIRLNGLNLPLSYLNGMEFSCPPSWQDNIN